MTWALKGALPVATPHLASRSRLIPRHHKLAGKAARSHRSFWVFSMAPTPEDKEVWVCTGNKDVLTAALESGITTLLVSPGATATRQLAAWRQLGRFTAVTADEAGRLTGEQGEAVGVLRRLATPADVAAAEREAGREGVVVVEALDWQVIPAENLVAAFQGAGARARLLAVASSCEAGRVMLEALETGTHGVVLQTDDPGQVRQLVSYLAQRRAQHAQRLSYTPATVTRVLPVGMGDRVCVDLASLLVPGEGLAVGSFARGMFLVHSECGESAYINSRPFRVNAGPVHSYVRMPGGRTAYLSELKAGAEVAVCDAAGSEATAIVGRCKIEARPLVLVEARTPGGDTLSVMLQNAETVKLIGPAPGPAGAAARPAAEAAPGSRQHAGGVQGGAAQEEQQCCQEEEGRGEPQMQRRASNGGREAGKPRGELGSPVHVAAVGAGSGVPWRAISVSSLREGDEVLVLEQHGARHTGLSIQERVQEV